MIRPTGQRPVEGLAPREPLTEPAALEGELIRAPTAQAEPRPRRAGVGIDPQSGAVAGPSSTVVPWDPARPQPILSQAARVKPASLWARLKASLGLGGKLLTPASAAVAGAARGFAPSQGAPLGSPVGVPAISPALEHELQELRAASGEDFVARLGRLSPSEVAQVDAACGQGWAGGSLSLRELIHARTSGRARRQALDLLEVGIAEVFRGGGPALHDLAADPAGVRGPAVDGRLPQTVHKVLELRRLGRIATPDLATRHEVTGNNEIELLGSPAQAFERMLETVRGAKDFVHLAFFIWKGERGEQLADALIERARAGVEVRVTLDELGALLGSNLIALERLMSKLRDGGVQVVCNRAVDFGRPVGTFGGPDHRKILVVDGQVAVIGGLNVGDEYIDEWHDHAVLIRGDAVHQIHGEWILGWLALGGELAPGASDDEVRARYFPKSEATGGVRAKVLQGLPNENPEILAATLQLIREAERTLWIENPYITEAEIHAALEAAVARGVQVKLIIPAENNHFFCDLIARPAFKRLLEAGAEIYAYPGMAHGKVMMVDERHVSVGTANLDDLSLHKIAELNVVTDDPGFAAMARREIFERDISRSRRLSVEDITPLQERFGQIWRVFAPFL